MIVSVLKNKAVGISILVLMMTVVFSITSYGQKQNQKKMNVTFTNITDEQIKDSFLEVYKKYTNIHDYKITVIQKRIGSTTMQAQPIIGIKHLFNGKKEYKIVIGKYLKDTNIELAEVPLEVLKGWFAHELGHVSDYKEYSNWGMIWYGIKYLTLKSFKKQVEHKADYIALTKGFKNQLLKTKRYILLSDVFSSKYLINMNKYYMPLDTVKNYIEDKEGVTLSKMYHD
ncbi:hypothetical protein FHR24_001605 [Wenyingzhuangia heitensis]|uniref:Peptidase n=1 Tax=Wenyingzhuangia heitensis TaxID=1487859 RepID=A0ABX0UDC5_9FLAO|nr:hypothetical protein [Wenyingzhuangia heitensis]NIJ45166.1 hypothetical protein [Wenyingzhuangia heitensis]